MSIVLYILLAIATFFFWTTIHELSHIAAAKFIKPNILRGWHIKPWPHTSGDKWYWGAAYYDYNRAPTKLEHASVAIAPMIYRILAFVGFGTYHLLPDSMFIGWSIFWCGCMVDAIVGSLGISKRSDLRRFAEFYPMNIWAVRITALVTFGSLLGASLAVIIVRLTNGI